MIDRALWVKTGLNLIGTPYIYGQSDRTGMDCSGFYRYRFLKLLKLNFNAVMNCQYLFEKLKPIDVANVKPGDACFYGKRGKIIHVMDLLYRPLGTFIPGMVVGACGGDSTTRSATPGAQVQVRGAVRYRDPDDFIGYGSMAEFLKD